MIVSETAKNAGDFNRGSPQVPFQVFVDSFLEVFNPFVEVKKQWILYLGIFDLIGIGTEHPGGTAILML